MWYLISLSFTFVVDDDASIIEIFLRIRLLLLSFVFVFIKRVRLDNVVEKDEKDDDVVAENCPLEVAVVLIVAF